MRGRVVFICIVLLLVAVAHQAYRPAPVDDRAYDRAAFSGWIDADGDCQSTRTEMLIAASVEQVDLSGNGCTVVFGNWTDPYSGEVFWVASDVHIDHLVPLKWAWDRGAADWSAEQRHRFALDPANLRIVSASLNMAKGARGPMDWLPPDPAAHCDYLSHFLKIVTDYNLRVRADWRDWMDRSRTAACRDDGRV